MPKRIQRKRTKGWRMPPNTVYVGRPSRWGNWHIVGKAYDARPVPRTPAEAVANFRADCEYWQEESPCEFADGIAPLRGKDLCCYCPLDQPCHADVLLELANAPKETP